MASSQASKNGGRGGASCTVYIHIQSNVRQGVKRGVLTLQVHVAGLHVGCRDEAVGHGTNMICCMSQDVVQLAPHTTKHLELQDTLPGTQL